MLVMKFGGSSVGSAQRIKQVAQILPSNQKAVVVLSAISGATNALTEIASLLFAKKHEEAICKIKELKESHLKVANELFSNESYLNNANSMINSHIDHLLSYTQDSFTVHEEKAVLAQGELLSTAIFHFYLQELDLNSALLPALEFMRIDRELEPDYFYIKQNLTRILKDDEDKSIFVTQGYICRNVYGEIDNLKRGGSDFSASLIAAAIGAEELQIWTDIDGMHNNDPRVVEKTNPIHELSFDEAAELAYFGAKILHPSSVTPAKRANIPVRLKNTLNPGSEGTLITAAENGSGVKAVAAKDGIIAIKIVSGRMLLAYGFLRKVFEIFEIHQIPIDMVTTSEVAVSLTIDDSSKLDLLKSDLSKYGTVEIDEDQTIICIVGNFINEEKGMAAKIFTALRDIPLRMISFGGSRHNVSVLVDTKNKKQALTALNNELF